jgi:hypothetical protein
MADRLIEDIISVTETLAVTDIVDIEAYAHPDAKLTLNDKIKNANNALAGNAGVWGQEKVKDLRRKMEEHRKGDGVFKRGAC